MTPDAAQRRTPRPLARVAALAVAALLPLAAAAQPIAPLPNDAAINPTPSPAQRDAITAFLGAQADALAAAIADDNPAAARVASDEIAGPLRLPRVSVAFRQLAAENLDGTLRATLRDEDAPAWAVVVALTLAGEVASEQTASLIAQSADADRATEAYAAAYAAEVMFLSAQRATPAYTAAAARRVVDTLADAISDAAGRPIDEQAAALLLGRVKALNAAITVGDELPGLSARAQERLAQSTGDVLLAAEPGDADPLREQAALSASEGIALALARPGGGQNTPRPALLATVRLGADLLEYTSRRLEAIDGDEPGDTLVSLASQSQLLLTVGSTALGSPLGGVDVADPVRGNNLRNFNVTRVRLLGPQGALFGQPYGFARDRYDRRG